MAFVWTYVACLFLFGVTGQHVIGRRFIVGGPQGYPSGYPGGDPMHQQNITHSWPAAGTDRTQCVSPANPCHCPMNFVASIGCYYCQCDGFHSVTIGNSILASISSAAPASPSPTSSTTETTTATPFTSSPVPVTMTTKFDACGIANQLCSSNCPQGYLVDPTDCTFCVCKERQEGK